MGHNGTIQAILAAFLFAVSIPLSKILLNSAEPTMLAGLLYLGAGTGMGLLSFITALTKKQNPHADQDNGKMNQPAESGSSRLTKADLPYTIGMVVLDIAAPIFMLMGLKTANAENASLLGNFEIVATTIIAAAFFHEKISKKLGAAILAITAASIVLSLNGSAQGLQFSVGSLYIILACCCWGLENNCTRMLSTKDASEIVLIKGLFSGSGSLIIALVLGESFPEPMILFAALCLGFVSYGLSIRCYIRAQAELGAAKTSAWYALNPFIGVVFSFILFRELPGIMFFVGLLLMGIGIWYLREDDLSHMHAHAHSHNHEHQHGDLVHTHMHSHEHAHEHVHHHGQPYHTHHHVKLHEKGAAHHHMHSANGA